MIALAAVMAVTAAACARATAQGASQTPGKTSSPVSEVVFSTVAKTIKVGKKPFGIAIAPDGRTAYVVNSGSGTVMELR